MSDRAGAWIAFAILVHALAMFVAASLGPGRYVPSLAGLSMRFDTQTAEFGPPRVAEELK